MSQQNEDKPKLIIDEDWKTQVAREREQLRDASREPDGSTAQSAETSPETDQTPASAYDTHQPPTPPPPASLPLLVSMLGTQALVAMGQLGDRENTPEIQLDYAKHYIDLLGVLEEKTRGNLTDDEAGLLRDWLYQLRLGFVELSKQR
jgi:hypothetical protein